MRNLLLGLCALLLLAGCAARQTQYAKETGEVLVEAGFLVQSPTTSAQTTHLNSLPQRKIFKIKRRGQDWYIFADAAGCGCLYVGNYAAYQSYRSLAWDKYLQTGQERLEYMTGDRNTSGGWNDWGPW